MIPVVSRVILTSDRHAHHSLYISYISLGRRDQLFIFSR